MVVSFTLKLVLYPDVLMVCVLMGCAGTLGLSLASGESWNGLLVAFSVAFVAFATGNVLYDSLLPAVASSYAFAWTGHFLVERNRNWMPVIESLFGRQGRSFIVVGAAHLIGPDGLVQMLKGKGYAVEQL